MIQSLSLGLLCAVFGGHLAAAIGALVGGAAGAAYGAVVWGLLGDTGILAAAKHGAGAGAYAGALALGVSMFVWLLAYVAMVTWHGLRAARTPAA